MASLSVNEQTDGSTPQETCILILFKTYILHRQGPGSNSIRKISTIFSYMISFIVFKKFFKKLLLSVVCSSSPNFSWKSRMLCAFCRTKKMSIAHFHVTKITMATGFKFAQIWRLASVSMPLLSNERQYSRTDQTSQRVTHICIKLELVFQHQALCKTIRTIKIWATKKSSNLLFKMRTFQKWIVALHCVSLNVIAFFKDPVTMLT